VHILVVNAGSTSLKLHAVDEAGDAVAVDRLHDVARGSVDAVAHRVVHGGARLRDPVVIDAAVREEIAALEPIAPLHNRPALAGIDAAIRALPDLPHVAVFDTAFHATIPEPAATYAIPERWRGWGIRRFGFHGLSVAWSAERACELLGRDARLVVCHLGGGCSVTAVAGGRSRDTTMGFSPLEGIPMVTRSGSVDPGAILYVLRERGLSPREVDEALNECSGLAALAGSKSVEEVLTRADGGDERARLAVDVFVGRLAQAVGAMAVAAGGLDALVFTAGIGENSARIRELTSERLRFLGVELDWVRNETAEPDADVAADGAPVRVQVIRAREELVAARLVRALIAST